MNERTQNYLDGRFGDYYRGRSFPLPDNADTRLWQFSYWGGSETEELSLEEIGSIDDFVSGEHPRTVEYTASKYDNPTESDNEITGSDLLIKLSAKYIPYITDEMSFTEKIEEVQEILPTIYTKLSDDLGFDDITVTYNGNTGFIIRVSDDSIQNLSESGRADIANYVSGDSFDIEEFPKNTETGKAAVGSEQVVMLAGGWYGDFYPEFIEFLEQTRELDKEKAVTKLKEYPGVGQKTAEGVYETLEERFEPIIAGNIRSDNGIKKLAGGFAEEFMEGRSAYLEVAESKDREATTQFERSLNGDTGFRVLGVDDFKEFSPLPDAIPDTFENHQINIKCEEETEVELFDEIYELSEGENRVPEYVGIYLMAQGVAEKSSE